MANTNYSDILDLIPTPPLWWDENAAPRYCPFGRDRCAMLGDEALLLLICCQNCGTEFRVAMTWDKLEGELEKTKSLQELVEADSSDWPSLHYGDPPNVGCCGPGYTMNSVPLRVLEFWQRGHLSSDYTRRHDLEIQLNDKTRWFKEAERELMDQLEDLANTSAQCVRCGDEIGGVATHKVPEPLKDAGSPVCVECWDKWGRVEPHGD